MISASIEIIICCFLLCSLNMMNYTGWFSNVEPVLHSWNQSHLVMMYNPFSILLKFCAEIMLRIFLHLSLWGVLVILLFSCNAFVWLWNQHNVGHIKWDGKKNEMGSSSSPSILCKSSCKIGLISSLNVW